MRLSAPISWLGSALALVVPKCPACFAAWAGVLGTLHLAEPHLRGLLAMALLLALLGFALSAQRHGRWLTVVAAAAGAVALVAGRLLASDRWVLVGAAMLTAALAADLVARCLPRARPGTPPRQPAGRSCCEPRAASAERA